MDPAYGVKFGSNFQPFVRRRDVTHGDDEDFTREPEMVQAYRDTWELGLHSYLTYLRDRFLVARELLTPSGSLFVQISDDNVHPVREMLDEVFGAEPFCAQIAVENATGLTSALIPGLVDYLLWYGGDGANVKYRHLFVPREVDDLGGEFRFIDLGDGKWRQLTDSELAVPAALDLARVFRTNSAVSPGIRANTTG